MPSSSVARTSDGHRTVLLHEAVEQLSLRKNDVVVDGTLGGAGHALAIAKQLGTGGTLIGVDADSDAVSRARDMLADAQAPGDNGSPVPLTGDGPTVLLINDNFRNLKNALASVRIQEVDKVLFDLGWSQFQLSAGRGFSFQTDEPLSMSYSKNATLTAETIVNDWSEESISDILFGFGEERYSRRIAERIVRERANSRIQTARQLAEIIRAAVPAAYRHGKIHPATKSFQALRIAVNDEFGALKAGMEAAWSLLKAGGRLAIISFHSSEDRIVKHRFAEWARDGQGNLITRRPITPSEGEVKENPRSRSAKLRVIEKI
ncbi:MAG: 16S rRNA (cytosine(1402)-N(4))-methyltransferase RsmH [Candidatus Pacebacteria bacterium]|nr:16S rRNA (cytosine(1402)-N(4))-methyltransferase RsmH [Candidatus Paceibacterota bacterium]